MWRRYLFAGVCAVSIAVPSSAESGRILVLTETQSAAGAAVGVQAWLVDASMNRTAGPLVVPGHRLAQPPVITPDGRLAVVRTQQRVGPGLAVESDRKTLVTLIDLQPFRRLSPSPKLMPGSWETSDVLPARDAEADGADVVILETHRDVNRARARQVHLGMGSAGPEIRVQKTVALPGEPLVGSMSADGSTTAVVLRHFKSGRFEASVLSWNARDNVMTTVRLPDEGTTPDRPTGIWEQGPDTWWVSIAKRDATEPVRGRITQLYALDTVQNQAKPTGIALPGTSGRADSSASSTGRVWMSTFREAEGFGYVLGLDTSGPTVERVWERAFTRSTHPPLFARSRDSHVLAMASGTTLEIQGTREDSLIRREFGEAVGAIAWSDGSLIVGIGGAIVGVNGSTGRSIKSQALGSGFVRAIAPFTTDGAWPHGEERLGIPARIHVDASVVGRRQRNFPVQPDETWTFVAFNDAWSDAISLLPSAAGATDVMGLALTADVPTQTLASGTVGMLLRESVNGRPALQIPVTIAPSDRSPPRALWLRALTDDRVDSVSLDAARRLLAGPPLFTSHSERWGPLLEPPTDADVVVVDLAAATEGTLTREVLLSFVGRGGGLLLIAPYSEIPVSPSVARWLEPVGFFMDPNSRIVGRFSPAPNATYLRNVDALRIERGALLKWKEPVVAAMPGPTATDAVLAHRDYGYGRIAVLASSEPLRPEALAYSSHRLFLKALFGFLYRGDSRILDGDFDGLPDSLEDADKDGELGPFETDPLNPDTDGDFIPDGVEDANQDGVTDENETDPRNRDTDGDGIPDGADADPLPYAGAPIINRVEPDAGPAEGGTLLRITGRNFPVRSAVWVGGRRSNRVIRVDSTELVAFTPAHRPTRDALPYDIEVGLASGDRSVESNRAYTYTPRSTGTLHFDALSRIRRQYDAYGNFLGFAGRFSMRLEIPEIRINDVSFALRMPLDAFDEVRAAPSSELLALDRDIQLSLRGQREYVIRVTAGAPITESMNLGEVYWRSPHADRHAWPVTVSGLSPYLSVQWGGVATLRLGRIRIPYPGTTEPARSEVVP